MPKNRPFYVAPFTGWYYDANGVAYNIHTLAQELGVVSRLYDALGNPISSAGGAIKVALHDGSGNAIGSLGGGINTHDADVHRSIIIHYLFQDLASYTLSAPVAMGDTQITVTDAAGIIVGSYLHLTDNDTGAHDHELPVATVIDGNTATLNRPLDHAYTVAGTTVSRVTRAMNVSGSLASPQIFYVSPPPGEVWHVTSLSINMSDASAMDDGLFGGLSALTNGLVLRINYGNGTEYETVVSARSNGTLALKGFDVVYPDKAPAGTYALRATTNFKTLVDSIIRLTSNDRLELLVMDDLTGLLDMAVVIKAHVEGL